jgi:uncharacterized membrane protein HdeD (DUF308 family)
MTDSTTPGIGGDTSASGSVSSDPATAAAAGPPAAASTTAAGGGAEEEIIRGAYSTVADNAPWKKGARWEVVVAQGVILGIAGLVIWLAPGFGAAAVLQLIAVLLLAMALLSVWRLVRGQVAPARLATVAFRAGVGVSIGLVTVIGSLIVEDRNTGTVAIAIVLGIGLVLYGLVAAASAIASRAGGIPIVGLLLAAVTVIVGILLVINGRNGIDALQGTFVLLGIVMLVVGVVLVGYGLMIRSAQAPAPASDD